MRLKWVAHRKPVQLRSCAVSGPGGSSGQLVLDSFELVPGAAESLESGGASAQACASAAALLTSLLQVPSSTVLTAEFLLSPAHPNVLRTLTPAFVNA